MKNHESNSRMILETGETGIGLLILTNLTARTSRCKTEINLGSLGPWGAYLISDLPERGLNREGGFLERGGVFTKSNDKDIFGRFSVLLSHILQNQQTIFLLKINI